MPIDTPSALESKLDKVSRLFNSGNGFLLGFSLLLSTFVGILLYFQVADPDVFARLAVGRLITDLGYVPTTDPFAFTPKLPVWYDHEWLAGVIFYRLYRAVGDPGLIGASLLSFAITCFYLFRAQQVTSSKMALPAMVLGLFIFEVAHIWISVVRAQIFTYLFLSFELFCFAKIRSDLTPPTWKAAILQRLPMLLILPPTYAVWVNMHGGFIAGLIFLSIFVIADTIRGVKGGALSILTLALSLSALLVNPYGIEFLKFVLEAAMKHRPSISEWWPRDLLQPNAILLDIGLLLVVFGYFKKVKLPIEGHLMILLGAVAAITHNRLSPLFCFPFLVYGTPIFESASDLLRSRFAAFHLKLSRALVAAAVVIPSIAALFTVRQLLTTNALSLNLSGYPVEAVDYLAKHGSGKLLVDFNNGSYALWKLYPKYLVSVDGRYEEVYPEATVKFIRDTYFAKGADLANRLDLLGANYILVDRGMVGEGWDKFYLSELKLDLDNGRFLILERTGR